MKYNTVPHQKAHLKPVWNELIDINLNFQEANKLNDSMGIIFKVIDYQGNNEIIGESHRIPIKNFISSEYSNQTIELFFNKVQVGKIFIERSF